MPRIISFVGSYIILKAVWISRYFHFQITVMVDITTNGDELLRNSLKVLLGPFLLFRDEVKNSYAIKHATLVMYRSILY